MDIITPTTDDRLLYLILTDEGLASSTKGNVIIKNVRRCSLV